MPRYFYSGIFLLFFWFIGCINVSAHTINPKVIEKLTGETVTQHHNEETEAEGDPRTLTRRLYTIPEWYIVYHAQEYGTLVQNGGRPSQFRYFSAISQVKNSWKEASKFADEAPDPTTNTILWTIYISSTIENVVIGLYEYTIGFITELLHFRHKTAEDIYIDTVAYEYGQWLVHTPWYEFSYGSALKGLWTTWSWTSITPRGIERRISYTVGYSIKLLYAQVIRLASQSQFGGATLATELTVTDIPLEIAFSIVGMTHVETHDNEIIHGLAPRYRALLPTINDLLENEATITTIQNHDVVTVSIVSTSECSTLTSWLLFSFPTLDKTGQTRYFYDIPLSELTSFAREATTTCNQPIEHLYDF